MQLWQPSLGKKIMGFSEKQCNYDNQVWDRKIMWFSGNHVVFLKKIGI